MSGTRKKVSMQDIADSLKISKNAVSLALNGKAGVSEETRELVMRVAQKLKYGGIDTTNRKASVILVLIPEYIRHDNYFYSTIYWTIEAYAKQQGCTAIMSTVSEDMQHKLEMPSIYYDIDFIGIIVIGVFSGAYISFLCTQTNNIVSVDNTYLANEINCVITDNIQGGYLITKHVIEKGHRDIGFVGSIYATASIFERWCGYQRAILGEGLQLNIDYSILDNSPLSSLLSNKEELLNPLKKMRCFPTAWICGGDRIAISLIEALKCLNIRVPDDISVAGFDNMEASTIITPALTTVNVRRKAMGKLAVDRLLSYDEKPYEKSKVMVYTDIIERDSVKSLTQANCEL